MQTGTLAIQSRIDLRSLVRVFDQEIWPAIVSRVPVTIPRLVGALDYQTKEITAKKNLQFAKLLGPSQLTEVEREVAEVSRLLESTNAGDNNSMSSMSSVSDDHVNDDNEQWEGGVGQE